MLSADQSIKPDLPPSSDKVADEPPPDIATLSVLFMIEAPPFTLSNTCPETPPANAGNAPTLNIANAEIIATALHAGLRRRNTLKPRMPLFMIDSSS